MISLDPTLRRLVTFLSLPLVAAAVFVLARHIVLSAGDDVAAIDVAITEGTNFAVAASPDGRMLVIDLLGSLWTVAAGGGAATRITDELLEARQPSVFAARRPDRVSGLRGQVGSVVNQNRRFRCKAADVWPVRRP
jgi:predicted RNase H-like nuclease